jgi:hypothetical protein
VLYSLLADAAHRFECGTGRLLQILWMENCFPTAGCAAPSEQAYRKACKKLPLELVSQCVELSHQQSRSERDQLYEGMRVLLVDGTKICVPRTPSTILQYGLGSGSVGDAYYPQIHAGGVLDLVTGTFRQLNIEHGIPAERAMLLQHAAENREQSLYVGDAGYNGMAHLYLMGLTGHHVLMAFKKHSLLKIFRKSRKRSWITSIQLTRHHLKNYPELSHLIGARLNIRLIRTRGTTKLRSKILITTLIDEQAYEWRDLCAIYLQRWNIELAFRHLKSRLRIEHIQKRSLQRIQQLLLAAIIYFNLSAIIRNQVRSPHLFPCKKGIRLHCFSFVLELADSFIRAALKPWFGMVTQLKRMLRAIRHCWFLYDPWRTRPKICQFSPSTFVRRKTTEKATDFSKCDAIRGDMRLLGIKYGQIDQ